MKSKLKILHVEDMPDDARLVGGALKKGMIDAEIVVVDNQKDFEKALHEFSPDVVLSDHSLPSFNSFEAFKIFKQSNLQIPFILVTATVSEEFAVSAIKSGVDDYILKDNLTRLPFAIEHALKKFKTEKEMQTILNRITDSVVSLDKEWRYTFINEAALATHPLGREATIGKVIWDVHPQMKDTIFWDKYHEAMETQRVAELETYYAPLDIWFYVKANPSPEGLTLVYQDVTERKNTQAIIARNEKKFRALIENSTDGLTVINTEGVVVEMSPSGHKILGYDESELIGKNSPELIHPDDRAMVMGAFNEIIIDPTNIKVLEYRHKMPDGSDKWLECTFQNLLEEPNIKAIVLNYRDITERKKNEVALAENENYLRTILNTEPECVKILNSKGELLSMNPAGLAMIEADNEQQVLGHRMTELVDEKYRIGFNRLSKEVFNGNSGTFEFEVTGLKGGHRWLETHAVPLKDAAGKVINLLGVTRDITERKKAEQFIKESEEKFRSAFNASPDAISLSSIRSGKIMEVNEGFTISLGISKEEAIGKSSLELGIIKESELREQTVKQVATKENFTTLEINFYNKQQEQLSGLLSFKRISWNNEDCLISFLRDITDRKKADERQKLFTSIVNSSDDAIISKTLKGIITSWNHGAEKVFGYVSDEIVGKPITVLIPAHLQSEEVEIIDKISRGEKISHYETVRVTKDGRMRNVSLTISPIKDSSGMVVGASKILRDITDKKQIEDALKKNTLELERSNKELEQFAYIASHDLQEPLRMVGSYMQLIERRYKGKLDSDADEFIHYAVDGAARMKQLINDLLDYSRLNKEVDHSMVDLNQVIQVVRQNLSESTRENNAQLMVSGLPLIEAQETQMIQLFQNLIGNALKFRQKETDPVIRIMAEKRKDQWLFSVSDNGIGIEKEYADKIFIIFKKLHTLDKYSGTGIGLAIAKKIVERHGGKIWFESEIGKGTTFFFTLNLKQ